MKGRGTWVIPAAMFFGSFAWSFVYVSLPFHIQRMSTLDEAATLRWTGWILGIAPLLTVVTAPLGGRLAGRRDPRMFYVATQILQGVAFVGMALARTLPELFLSRVALGIIGAGSTFAFMISGRADDPATVRREVAAVQSAMTVGQVLGPLAGAIAAARMGFRQSFVLGGLVLVACAAIAWFGAPGGEPVASGVAPEHRARPRDVLAVSLIVLGGSTQVFFLTSILPQVLPGLGVSAEAILDAGGVLMFVSGVAAALGSVATPRLGEVMAERRLLVTLLVVSSCLLAALAPLGSVWSYGVVRFLQVLCVAPVFPIVVARIAQHAGGSAIGIINSARIGAAFVGPVVATTLLAWAPLWALYVVLAAVGVACVPFVMRERARARSFA